MIGPLMLVHDAAVAFLAQNERLAATVLPLVFLWHVAGLLLALLCGFLAWASWSFHAAIYKAVSSSMIYDDERWPEFHCGTAQLIAATHWSGIVAGFLSALCILSSAVAAYQIMTP